LGERQLCKLDVAGSIPVTSTNFKYLADPKNQKLKLRDITARHSP